MKKLWKYITLLFLLIVGVFLLPYPVNAQAPDGDGNDEVIFGGVYRLEDGEILENDLVILGGQGILAKGSQVKGEIVIIGGTLDASGQVEGNLVILGGTARLTDTAVVKGDITTISGTFTRSDKAIIDGKITTAPIEGFKLDRINGFNFNEPGNKGVNPLNPRLWDIMGALDPIGKVFSSLLQVLTLAALAALVALFLLKPMERIADSIVATPVISGGLGLLTFVVAPALLIILVITIILIPLSLIGILALAIGMLFGWIAIGYEIGRRLAEAVKQDWAPPISAGVGTLLLSLVTGGIGLIPCIGWLAGFAFMCIGLGGVILSQFGRRTYISVPPSQNHPVSPESVPPASSFFVAQSPEQNPIVNPPPPIIPGVDEPKLKKGKKVKDITG
jgi:hypothetical protein